MEKRSQDFKDRVAEARYTAPLNKRAMIDDYGREVYDNGVFLVEYIYQKLDDQSIGSCRIIARKK